MSSNTSTANLNSFLRRRLSLWLVACVLIVPAVAAFYLDRPVQQWVDQHCNPAYTRLGSAISRYSKGYVVILVCGCMAAYAWARRDGRLLCLTLAALIGASTSGLASDVLKLATGRTRPNATVPRGWYGVYSRTEGITFPRFAFTSFPSGHVSTVSGLVATVLFLNWRRGLAIALLVPIVAWARIYVEAHWLSDIVAGMILGVAAGYWVWRVVFKRLAGLERRVDNLPPLSFRPNLRN